MRKNLVLILIGFAAGVSVTLLAVSLLPRSPLRAARTVDVPTTCYSCVWDGYGAKVRNDAIEFYRQYRSPDPLVMADAQYILWRASNNPNCDARKQYRTIAKDADAQRRYVALAVLGMGAGECGEDGSSDLRAAARAAKEIGRSAEATLLEAAATHELRPQVEPTEIRTALTPPAGAKTIILGASRIEVPAGMRIGTQVDRVARDWVSYQMKWDFTQKPLAAEQLIPYHEGALLKEVARRGRVEIFPLTGTPIARANAQWYAPDEQGRFRFAVLEDKVQYPTTHQSGEVGWIEDTHGISVLVAPALESKVQLVVGCGDSEGKAKAADYLSQRGVPVVFPGDRYQDLLLGYTGSGTLIGTAPVKQENGATIIGGQPVRFALDETIVVEDTNRPFPMQYYDAPARYFRKLNSFVRLKLDYVLVDGPDEMGKVLNRAKEKRANAVAVRITTLNEAVRLRDWLDHDPRRRAILFHSGLYPYAQPLFRDYPRQVTFGDLRPKFE